MIELSPLARPYAKAIFGAALDAGSHELIAKDLVLLSAVSQTTEVSSLIEDPALSKEQIAQTIIGLADDEIGGLSIKMLELLAENKRLNLIAAINTSYQELLEQHNNTSSIVVNVANQPSEDNKQMIVEKLLTEHGEGSNIEFLEDPSIMGGLSIKIGDETLDLSIRGKVKKLVNQLNF
ncbi:F0F1 ATP synthase subunit delta [Gammaproteobacteria bacterium]|jgi:F-type H+-transporting ATPase subunit delta|nr:F0F1 ATP synthase subunit delta [Gammaproteobacteria bacterium]MDA9204931.1 F0F1 ATP synthase subunit delta [Gammaproteobacteria bacterium]MDB2370719.1 F0F1 ATP synthase subunit delta [Gammaproteobacteria bacterium]MDB3881235.1 F0F1 ATP synthase subunit delta [Gammaproteobacteria bacterium]